MYTIAKTWQDLLVSLISATQDAWITLLVADFKKKLNFDNGERRERTSYFL